MAIDQPNDELDRLAKIKKNIETSHKYFKANYDRFNDSRRFVFYSSLTEDDKIKLMSLGKPVVTGNVLESFLSRMRGNFLDNEPSIGVRQNDCVSRVTMVDADQIEFLECHLREILANPDNDSFGYGVYTDTMSGGFSWAEIYTKYSNERAWEQEICVEKCFDPTLCGADPLAEESHKGDGEYVYKIIPLTKEKFIARYGEEAARDITFASAAEATLTDFRWSYQLNNIEIVLVAEYYWKKRRRERLFRLSNGKSVTKKELEELMLEYELSGAIEQPPIVVQDRMQEFVTIMRDEICQTKILSSEKTDFSMFPLIFCDGNSEMLKSATAPGISQVTRPYIYHAMGAQRLKDFSLQTAAAEIENMMMSKLMVPVEGLPQDEGLLKSYTNYQQSSVITYNNYDLDNPEKVLQPPREIQRTPTPPIVMESFMACDNLIQQILGSYDLQPAMTRDISGETIKQGALQASESAKPYLKSYNMFLERIAEGVIDLITKYYDTPRTVPVRSRDGKRGYQILNDPNDQDSISTQYEPSALQVTVEAGPSINAQRQMALKQLTEVGKVLPSFAQFLDQEGGEIIIDNMDLKGGDRLKIMYTQWMEQNKQKQAQSQQAQQQAQQALMQAQIQKEQAAAFKSQADAASTMKKTNDAETQFVANMILEEQKNQQEMALESAKIEIAQQQNDIAALKAQGDIQDNHISAILRAMEVHAENARTQIETALAVDQHVHQKEVDMATLENDRKKGQKAAD